MRGHESWDPGGAVLSFREWLHKAHCARGLRRSAPCWRCCCFCLLLFPVRVCFVGRPSQVKHARSPPILALHLYPSFQAPVLSLHLHPRLAADMCRGRCVIQRLNVITNTAQHPFSCKRHVARPGPPSPDAVSDRRYDFSWGTPRWQAPFSKRERGPGQSKRARARPAQGQMAP